MTILFNGPEGLAVANISYASYNEEFGYLWLLIDDANVALQEIQFDMDESTANIIIKELYNTGKVDFTIYGRARMSD